MNDQEIIEKLQRLVQDIIGDEDFILTKKTRFEDLGISSFGLVQLICAIEDTFDIEIPNEALRSINGVSAAVKCIKRELKTRG